MNLFDYKIRKMARKSKFPKDIESERKIEELLSQLSNKEDDKREDSVAIKKKPAVVLVLVLVCLIAFPVTAAIDYVAKRMEGVTQLEQEELYSEAMNGVGEAITYSRPLSDEERARYDELFSKYENQGLFPSSELSRAESYYSDDNSELVFIIENRTMILPERNLTDEEMLQIIDYYHKVDYSLQSINQATSEEPENSELVTAAEGELTETEAQEKAVFYLNSVGVTNADEYAMKTTYETDPVGIIDSKYVVDFSLGEKIQYEISISPVDGSLQSLSIVDENKNYYDETAKPQSDIIMKTQKKAKEMCGNFCEIAIDEQKSFTGYKTNENGEIPTGNIRIYCALENGDAYCFMYNLPENEFYHIYYLCGLTQAMEAQNMKDGAYNQKGWRENIVPFIED